jgi:hypothetical protein
VDGDYGVLDYATVKLFDYFMTSTAYLVNPLYNAYLEVDVSTLFESLVRAPATHVVILTHQLTTLNCHPETPAPNG